jgi:hypothetical protein
MLEDGERVRLTDAQVDREGSRRDEPAIERHGCDDRFPIEDGHESSFAQRSRRAPGRDDVTRVRISRGRAQVTGSPAHFGDIFPCERPSVDFSNVGA